MKATDSAEGNVAIDVTTTPAATLSKNNTTKDWLLDVTFVTAVIAKHLPADTQRSSNALRKAKQRKNNAYQGCYDPSTILS